MKLLLCVLLFSQLGFTKFVQGSSKFYSDPEDSLSDVKKYLIYLATKDIVSKELEALGLDKDAFWLSYEDTLAEKLEPLRESLEERYKVGDDKQTRRQKQLYQQVWRKQKLKMERSHGNLQSVLDSYKVERMSRAQNNPSLKFLRMEGKVNTNKLRKTYFDFFRVSKNRSVEKLYVHIDLQLVEGDWALVGVESKNAILEPLYESVVKKLADDLRGLVISVNETDTTDIERIEAHLRLDDQQLNQQIEEYRQLRIARAQENVGESAIEDSPTSKAVSTETFFSRGSLVNSLYAKVELKVKLKELVKEINHLQVEYSGDIIVMDMQFNEPFYFGKLRDNRFEIFEEKTVKLGSKLASQIYQEVVSHGVSIKKNMANLTEKKNEIIVFVQGTSSVLEAIEVQKKIREKAIKLRADTRLKSFGVSSAEILVEFTGEKTDLGKILLGLKNQGLANGKMMNIASLEEPFTIDLRK